MTPSLRARPRSSRIAAALASLAALIIAPSARAVPGPDSVVVVANENVAESVALAETYRVARGLPLARVCAVDAPTEVDIALDAYRTRIFEPLSRCLEERNLAAATEAFVVMRGMPLRVLVPVAGGAPQSISITAALAAWKSDVSGRPLLGEAPGMPTTCAGGVPCLFPRWQNPFTSGVFEPGWERRRGVVRFELMLATMLHGYTFADAERLLDSALAAERDGPPTGRFVFMNGGDAARASYDFMYDDVIAALAGRGFPDVARVAYDPNWSGPALASFIVGTLSLGSTIEGNTFLPGSIVDNLTSFGAVPENFAAGPENQVSVARFVAKGVAGVHGTTDEPLAVAFPSRGLLLSYVDGGTLAESFLRAMPFVYWRNLVLGDPMAAPYAVRPEVALVGIDSAERVEGARRVRATATDATGRGIASLRLLLDGVEIAAVDGDSLEACVHAPAGRAHLLAVAQLRDDGTDQGLHRPKGWRVVEFDGVEAAGDCVDELDAGVGVDAGPSADAGVDAADAGVTDAGAIPTASKVGGGCAIAARAEARHSLLAVFLSLTAFCMRRRRARHRV